MKWSLHWVAWTWEPPPWSSRHLSTIAVIDFSLMVLLSFLNAVFYLDPKCFHFWRKYPAGMSSDKQSHFKGGIASQRHTWSPTAPQKEPFYVTNVSRWRLPPPWTALMSVLRRGDRDSGLSVRSCGPTKPVKRLRRDKLPKRNQGNNGVTEKTVYSPAGTFQWSSTKQKHDDKRNHNKSIDEK